MQVEYAKGERWPEKQQRSLAARHANKQYKDGEGKTNQSDMKCSEGASTPDTQRF